MEGVDIDAFDYAHLQDTREHVVASAIKAIIGGGYDARAKDTGLSLQTERLILPRLLKEADMPFAELVSICDASFNCTLGALSMSSRESGLRLYFFYPLAVLAFSDVLVDARNEHLMK